MTRKNAIAQLNSKSVPSAGMRGGLGRTLLTAFLLLSIVPLSLISFVAATQARHDLEQELREKLTAVAVLTGSQIQNWVANQQSILAILSSSLAAQPERVPALAPISNSSQRPEPDDEASVHAETASHVLERILATHGDDPAYMAWLLLDQQGKIIEAHPPITENAAYPDLSQVQQGLLEPESPILQAFSHPSNAPSSPAIMLAQPVGETGLTLVALFSLSDLAGTIDVAALWDQDSAAYIVESSGRALELSAYKHGMDSVTISNRPEETHRSITIDVALLGQTGAATYENHQGEQVIGAYHWLPELESAVLVEQAQSSAFAASDDLAVVLIGATLAAVLITALIAATVTRRITLPIVQLTATAVQIAAGDLDQKVPATRRDEIGILARAFNVMTTKLRLLYEDLEQKVRERTQQLQDANAEIRYQAMLLAISAEVGRVVTSILDRKLLLAKVVELIRDCFQVYFVAIYFVDDSGQWVVLQEATGGLGAQLKTTDHKISLRGDHLVSKAANSLEPQMGAGASLKRHIDRGLFPHTYAELAIPLKIGERLIGVLDVHSTQKDAFDGSEIMVLETLSGQVVVAIENARAYQVERQAAVRLRELEDLRRRFLSRMSRELRMPLNTIIGFSRVMLKEIDGPITDRQREDLNAIHDSGQQLLMLINDILDIAQIEAGAMELCVEPVDLGEIAQSVIPTAGALLEGRPIGFHFEIDADLPPVLADASRLRQVLVKLISNAAKFTREGEIRLHVWRDTHEVMASVSDTGIGIPDKDRDKVYEMFRQLSQPIDLKMRGTGLGLAFSKEIVEMHGGTIRLESKEGTGTAFIIALPIAAQEARNQQ